MADKDQFESGALQNETVQNATYENIYLQEDRVRQPKEAFKQIADLIEAEGRPGDASLLDAGCATGEFLAYLQTCFGNYALSGIDIAESLIDSAKQKFPGISFTAGSITDPGMTDGETYDVIVCVGVLPIFDDPTPALTNFIAHLKPGGTLYVGGSFNDEPVDALVRYRLADSDDDNWKPGWNIFSIRTVEKILKGADPGIEIDWHPFRMPFAIPKTDDPMRSWTIETADDPFQQTNGVCQLRKVYTLQARRPAV